MTKLNLMDIASKVESEEASQVAFQKKYPGGRFERSQLGLSAADRERGYTYLVPRFAPSREAEGSWERWASDYDRQLEKWNGKPEPEAAKVESAVAETEQQRQRQRKRAKPSGGITSERVVKV